MIESHKNGEFDLNGVGWVDKGRAMSRVLKRVDCTWSQSR